MKHFTGTIDWTHEDEKGESPLGYPATLELQISYTWHCGERETRIDPATPDEIVAFNGLCTKIITDKEEIKPSDKLSEAIGLWFLMNFSECPRLYEECCDDAYHEMNAYQENQWEWEKENN